jgi:hypothetical protein
MKNTRIFHFQTITSMGSTQPPSQWIPGALSPGVKRLGREADHPPPSAEVNNAWSCTSTPPFWLHLVWCLVKHKENFTFYTILEKDHSAILITRYTCFTKRASMMLYQDKNCFKKTAQVDEMTYQGWTRCHCCYDILRAVIFKCHELTN